MAKTIWRRGTPLEDSLQAKLRELVRQHGEKRVANILEISEISVLRAAAAAGLRKGTALWIRTKLSELKAA